MAKSDTNAAAKQDRSIGRERIACLKKIVQKKQLKQIVRRRRLDKRHSKKCPAYLMVWFNIAIWFFGSDCYTQVFRLLHRFSKEFTPTSSALTQARAKIGVPIMADIYRAVVRCLCSEQTPDSFYAGRRLVRAEPAGLTGQPPGLRTAQERKLLWSVSASANRGPLRSRVARLFQLPR